MPIPNDQPKAPSDQLGPAELASQTELDCQTDSEEHAELDEQTEPLVEIDLQGTGRELSACTPTDRAGEGAI